MEQAATPGGTLIGQKVVRRATQPLGQNSICSGGSLRLLESWITALCTALGRLMGLSLSWWHDSDLDWCDVVG